MLLLTAGALGATAPSARAAVTISSDHVVVSTDAGASATITRVPFRLEFADAGGAPVLSEVPNSGQAPMLILPVPQPEPLGTDNLDGPTLYAPLNFTVGDRMSTQFPATPWVGNELTAAQVGVQYSARDVIDVQSEGDSALVTLSTSDPSGRQLLVRVAPAGPAALRVDVRPTPATGVAAMSDSFLSPETEAFRGFGGRHNSLDQRGNDFYGWVEQQDTGAGELQPIPDVVPGTGADGYLFPNGPTAAYYAQSQFISSAGYGFLLDRSELSGWRLASDRPDAWQVTAAADGFDYIVAPGDPKAAIGALTAIGGRQRVPPDWAVGPALDRAVKLVDSSAAYTEQVRNDLRDIKRYDLPLSSYRFEGWEFLDRDFLRESIAELRKRGIRSLLYFRSFVGRDETGTDRPSYFDEAIANGYVTTTALGTPYVYVGNFNNLTAQIDFTNPAAVHWWRQRIFDALDLGADGFMQDFGEQVTNNMHFANGETGETMHNRYPVLYHQVTRDAVRDYEAAHPGREIFFFTRAGYSGTPGAAAYEGANFPGDENTDWSRSAGLASQTIDMLNRGIGGAYGYGTDIGGYFDFVSPATTKELLLRWAQWAALSPLFRLHGSINAGTHTPWSYDRETGDLYKAISGLHELAGPLILKLWQQASETGIPIARPLWLELPGDPQVQDPDPQHETAIEQQWLLGPDVLVAPVVGEGATSRQVYFPQGCWQRRDTDYLPIQGEVYDGPGLQSVAAPLDSLPYFTRCGTNPFGARPCTPPLKGTRGRDVFKGTRDSDRFSGRGGRDRISGRRSRDCLAGGAARDGVEGGPGADRIRGGGGSDRLRGNGGRDKLNGGPGRDRISGGPGGDLIKARDDSPDVIRCGPGRDRVRAGRDDRVGRDCERVRRRASRRRVESAAGVGGAQPSTR